MEDTIPRFSLKSVSALPLALPPPTPEPLVHFENTLAGVGGHRTENRVPFRAQVEAVPFDGRHDPILGATEDICQRGLFIKSRRRIPVDALVILRLRTCHGGLRLTARVVHNIDGIGFGCEFIDLTQSQRVKLSVLATHTGAPS